MRSAALDSTSCIRGCRCCERLHLQIEYGVFKLDPAAKRVYLSLRAPQIQNVLNEREKTEEQASLVPWSYVEESLALRLHPKNGRPTMAGAAPGIQSMAHGWSRERPELLMVAGPRIYDGSRPTCAHEERGCGWYRPGPAHSVVPLNCGLVAARCCSGCTGNGLG